MANQKKKKNAKDKKIRGSDQRTEVFLLVCFKYLTIKHSACRPICARRDFPAKLNDPPCMCASVGAGHLDTGGEYVQRHPLTSRAFLLLWSSLEISRATLSTKSLGLFLLISNWLFFSL